MLTVHFALVTVQERHWKDVVSNGSGYELAQHLKEKRQNIVTTGSSCTPRRVVALLANVSANIAPCF